MIQNCRKYEIQLCRDRYYYRRSKWERRVDAISLAVSAIGLAGSVWFWVSLF